MCWSPEPICAAAAARTSGILTNSRIQRTCALTCVVIDIEVSWDFYDVPGAGLPVVGEVHVVLVVEETEADLVAGEGPGPELHDAGLLVEGEVRHVNCAGGLKHDIG